MEMAEQKEGKETEIESRLRLEHQARSGASWFYWIAGLSVVNTIMLFGNFGWVFIFGLGVTQVVDGFATGFGTETATIMALIIDLVVVCTFILFGYFSLKGYSWLFIMGMVLYALDGLILLFFEDIISVGFHALALYWMYGGLMAQKKLAGLKGNADSTKPR